MDVAASTCSPHEQASRDEDHVPAVAQSKATHDEDAEEERPTDHSSPASSSSLDEAADQSPRAEADAARAPEGKAPDGDESSAMGLTAEQEQLLAMLDSVVVEQGKEERGEEEEEATNEGKAGDGEGKEEGEKNGLIDMVDSQEEQGEDMELENEEKDGGSDKEEEEEEEKSEQKQEEEVECPDIPETTVEEPRLLVPKLEVKEEVEDDQAAPPLLFSNTENEEEEDAQPGDESATMTDPLPEDEWLAQLPSFVEPNAKYNSQSMRQRIDFLQLVAEEIIARGGYEDLVAEIRSEREELVEQLGQLEQQKDWFVKFLANPHPSAVVLDEKWRQTFKWTESIRDTLWRVYKSRKFRPMQEEAINAALSGEDVFVLMTTGAGKSLCYELPALYSNGVTVVISPLKSLMTDQLNRMQSSFSRRIVQALHSDLSGSKHTEILQELRDGGATSHLQLKLLYVAPETLFQRYAQEVFKKLHDKGCLARFVVDEVHLMDAWVSFRPDYANLSQLREWFSRVPITTTTATAPPPVLEAVCKSLRLHNPVILLHNPPRRELSLSVFDRTGEQQLIDWVKTNWPDACGIVYALTRTSVNSLCKALREAGIAAGTYHSKCQKKEYTQWMADELKVIVATSAFGMGIDKPDVRYVVFYDLPQSMEAFHQGVGRAGRDGQRADGVIFWDHKDKRQILNVQQKGGKSRLSPEEMEKNKAAIDTMIEYCQLTDVCRMGTMTNYLATYFLEPGSYRCTDSADTEGVCDNCRGESESVNEESGAAQETAREIAGVILQIAEFVATKVDKSADTGPTSNVATLVDIFLGNRKDYIKDFKLHTTSHYGHGWCMEPTPHRDFVTDIVGQMVQKGILREDSVLGRKFISPGSHARRLETARFRTTMKPKVATNRATGTSPRNAKKSTASSGTRSGGNTRKSTIGKGKEKVAHTTFDDDDDDDVDLEAKSRPKKEKQKRKTTERTHSASALNPEYGCSAVDEPQPKRHRERSRSSSSRRSGSEVRPPSESVGGGRGTTASSPTAPRKPKQRSAKQAACAALVKKESYNPPNAVDDNEFTVEAVVDECTRRGEVFVKWEGYSDNTNTWEEKKGFISTAPIPYREFLQRAEREGRLITASGPCQCRRCEGEVENEEKKKKKKKEKEKEKNKKRKRRIESSADEESSDSYLQDDADTSETERMWKISHARAVRAEKAELMSLYDDDDDDDDGEDDDDPIGKDEDEQEEWIRGQQKSKPRPRDRKSRGTSEEPILID